jgi:ribosome-associated protein
MDIKKLQASVIDALEDVKAQDIRVFDTVHLTSLFDRLAIASGTSNRQTKALAASVRDKVKENGGTVISMEGEDTGEWVLVDLGDMVVHIMQPAIRAYYRLEEIWGDKEIDLAAAKKPVKRTATKTVTKSHISGAAKNTVAKKAPAKKAATKTTTGKTTAAKKTATKTVVKKTTKATASKSTAAAKKAPAKRAAKSA